VNVSHTAHSEGRSIPKTQAGHIIQSLRWPELVEVKLVEDIGDYVHLVGATTGSGEHVDQLIPREGVAQLQVALVKADFTASPREVFLGLEACRYHFASLYDPPPPEVQEAFQFLLAAAMHEGGNPRLGKFEFLNLAGGFPAKRTLLVTAIPRCQKTSHPNGPAIKLPTMELTKLTKLWFSQRQGQDGEGAEI
jgi:hypothetical protein